MNRWVGWGIGSGHFGLEEVPSLIRGSYTREVLAMMKCAEHSIHRHLLPQELLARRTPLKKCKQLQDGKFQEDHADLYLMMNIPWPPSAGLKASIPGINEIEAIYHFLSIDWYNTIYIYNIPLTLLGCAPDLKLDHILSNSYFCWLCFVAL